MSLLLESSFGFVTIPLQCKEERWWRKVRNRTEANVTRLIFRNINICKIQLVNRPIFMKYGYILPENLFKYLCM